MKRPTTTVRGGRHLGTVLAAVLLVAFAQATVSPALAQELLTNGDFETGNFTGWTVTDSGGGTFFISAPGTASPISASPTSPNAGGTYQLRFAEVDNQFFQQQGVDNVSIEFTPAAPTMGGWAAALLALLLLLAGLTALGHRSRGGAAGA